MHAPGLLLCTRPVYYYLQIRNTRISVAVYGGIVSASVEQFGMGYGAWGLGGRAHEHVDLDVRVAVGDPLGIGVGLGVPRRSGVQRSIFTPLRSGFRSNPLLPHVTEWCGSSFPPSPRTSGHARI